MDLGTDMMRDQPHDPLAVSGRQLLTAVRDALAQPIDPQPAIRVEHHLDHLVIVEPCRDRWTERGAQHPRTPPARIQS